MHHDETPIELDITQDERSTTQKASDGDSSLSKCNENMLHTERCRS